MGSRVARILERVAGDAAAGVPSLMSMPSADVFTMRLFSMTALSDLSAVDEDPMILPQLLLALPM